MNFTPLLFTFFFVFLLVGCSKPQQANKITVQFWFDNQQLGCDGLEKLAHSRLTIDQLGLYLSNLTLVNDSKTMPLKLSENSWQAEDVALVYLSSNCQQSHNQALTFAANIDNHQAQTLMFNVGVPFELNHQNPLSQPSPLNLPNMFWAWQSGHKFLRLDLKTQDKPFSFHLGSVGCASSSMVRAPKLPCAEPNFFGFKLDKKHQGDVLKVNLDNLLEGIDLSPESSCLFHGEQEPTCLLLIENLKTKQVFEWL